MPPEHTFLLGKARKYCAYQERSIFEVKTKLISWNINDKIISEIILSLKKDNFISEDRFAAAFALGKMRNNKWGRNKIIFF